MKISLNKKLSLGFLLAVIGSILIAVFISNGMISNKFSQYLMGEQNTKINNLLRTTEGFYTENNGFSNMNTDELQRYAELEKLFVEIRDTHDNLIYSSGSSYLQSNVMMGGMMKSMMHGSSVAQLGQYTEKKYSLTKNNKNIGTILIGYYGTSYITSGALSFKMTLNQSFIMSAVIALIFGLIISIVLSRQISLPLVKITAAANKMRDGNLDARVKLNNNTKEISELSSSINYLAETLQQQEMLRKRLTSDMAHEIRTPLTTLKTHVEALLDGVWEPTEERLQSFYDEIERLTKLVDNLRNLAKLEQVDLNLNKTKFNISKELEKIIGIFEPLYTKKNFQLFYKITPEINVSMDRDKFNQIMHNLLSNAYKALGHGGIVKVTLINGAEKIMIEVKDNGSGIPEKDLPHIFERFYRSDPSRNTNTGGSGIGLTITKALVEAHNGKIHVKSTLGKGTAFIVEFPKTIPMP